MTPPKFTYPKIPGPKDAPLKQCVGFEKLDGTNLARPWQRGHGFGGFSTRGGDFTWGHPVLGSAYKVFDEDVREKLDAALTNGLGLNDHAIAFFEFVGEYSFAGLHRSGERQRLVLIDVAIRLNDFTEDQFALIGPDRFLRDFAGRGLETPTVRWRGKFGGKALDAVEKLPSGSEGIVFKGGETGAVWMAKVKTKAWEARLKETFKDGKWRAADAIERGVDDDA